MLTTLRIKNLALVADLTLELQPGYNAITGETGAGKSILLGAGFPGDHVEMRIELHFDRFYDRIILYGQHPQHYC